MTALAKLTQWYSKQCNGDWEHSYTLDNPGVSLRVDLRETNLEAVPFTEKKEHYESADRWMVCGRTPDAFECRGAPSRMEDIIEEFLRWAHENEKA